MNAFMQSVARMVEDRRATRRKLFKTIMHHTTDFHQPQQMTKTLVSLKQTQRPTGAIGRKATELDFKMHKSASNKIHGLKLGHA